AAARGAAGERDDGRGAVDGRDDHDGGGPLAPPPSRSGALTPSGETRSSKEKRPGGEPPGLTTLHWARLARRTIAVRPSFRLEWGLVTGPLRSPVDRLPSAPPSIRTARLRRGRQLHRTPREYPTPPPHTNLRNSKRSLRPHNRYS